MKYLVMTKDQYIDGWNLKEVDGKGPAIPEVISASKEGKEVRIAVEVPFSLDISIGEPGEQVERQPAEEPEKTLETEEEVQRSETGQDKSEADQDSGE